MIYTIKNNTKLHKTIIISTILIVTIFCIFSMFTNKTYVGDDATFHINRIIGLANCFEEKQILPKIYPYANNGFGYASPLFYCDLFLYPFGILHHFGVGAVLCYKIAIIFYVLVGNAITYYVIKKLTNNDILALLGLSLYTFSNYHLQNVLLRSAFGEILAMSFLPLVFYALYRVLVKKEKSWMLLGVSFSLIVLSHLISTLLISIFFAFILIVFIIVNIKDKKAIFEVLGTVIKGTILALLLSGWYLLPMLEQLNDQTFWLSINAKSNDLSATTQTIKDILYVFACTDLESFSIYKQAGTGLLITLLTISYLFIKKNKYITTILIYSLLLILMNLGILKLELFNIIQFLFRNYIIITPLLTIVSIYVLFNITKYKKTIFTVILSILLLNSIMINSQVLNNGKLYLFNDSTKEEINSIDSYRYDIIYNHDELGGGEYLPYTEGYINYNNESPAIKYIDENDNKIDAIWQYDREFTKIVFNSNFNDDRTLIIPLTYYKGYKGYEIVDGTQKEIDLYNYQKYKELAINAPAGTHTYMVKYEGTVIQKITLAISGLTFIGLIVSLIYKKKKTR